MIEVNLHPAGPKAGRRRRRGGGGFALPFRIRPPAGGAGGTGGRDPWTLAAWGLSAVAVLVIAGLWFSQRGAAGAIERELEEAVADSVRLADLRQLSDSLTSRERAIRDRLGLVRSLDEGRFVWPHLMDEVSAALPAFTWLTAIRASTPLPDLSVQIDGVAANPLAITRFVRNLQASPFISRVRIIGSQQQLVEDVAAQAFKIVVHYRQPSDRDVERVPVGERGT
ncbi:MAG: PilN domain-containing protein [Gemmatimonadota bacterium]|nr:PilN domain-containing protein [Gemmatimonadota bacterium]